MIRSLLAATLLACLWAASGAQAQSRLCPQADADAAESSVDDIKDWKDVDLMYRRYRRCDEGSISEGTSAAIARILTQRWSELPTLAALAGSEPGLRPFVLNHINSTLATQDLDQIASSAASSCPAGAATLCRQIRKAASAAARS